MVMIDVVTRLDTILLQFVLSWQGTFPLLDSSIMWIADTSRVFMAGLLLIGLFWAFINCFRHNPMQLGAKPSSWKLVLKLVGAVIVLIVLPIVLSDLLREIIMRDRPFVVLDVEPMLEQTIRPSLPSNHTTASFAISGFFLVYLPKAFPWVGILAALVGFARIFTGIHYPLDVLAGAILGLLPALLYLQIKRQTSRNTGGYYE